jgi:hypothetical protein
MNNINLDKIKNDILREDLSPWHNALKLTMLSRKVLENIQFCLEDCETNNVEGDFIECGVWRGGACIFAREVIKNLNSKRKIYVADSFEGLPKPNSQKYPADAGDPHYQISQLRVSLEEVKNNFNKFRDLDDNVIFLKGWFKDTLPNCQIQKISVLRMDGDMYESTMDTLNNLYNKLSIGGYCIIDDYGHKGAKTAVIDYRKKYNIEDPIIIIDPRPNAYPSAYWKKSKDI